MPQFYINSENVQGNQILITDKSDIVHITNVLRLRNGDKLDLIDSSGYAYKVKIKEILNDVISAEIIEKYKSDKTLNISITLAQSILKSAKQDLLIQKATELGVKKIIPFISKNTVVKFDSEKDKTQKVQRWQKIAYEAAKQCERFDLPEVSNISSIFEIINIDNFDIKFVCTERTANCTIKSYLAENKINHNQNISILVIVGPEGGWDNGELKLFKDNNLATVSLGNLILRAETAAISAISDIIYEYEL